MSAPSKMSRSSSARGAITWVGVAMIVGFAAAAYLVWTWGPVYAQHYEVRQIVDEFGHQAIKNPDDEQLIAGMVERIHALGQIAVEGPDGRAVMRPVIDVRVQDVFWKRVSNSSLHVAFDYDRLVELPLLGRRLERVMHVDRTVDITRPAWGASG